MGDVVLFVDPQAQAVVDELKAGGVLIVNDAGAIPEVTDANVDDAAAMLSRTSGYLKEAEKQRKRLKQPHLDGARLVDEFFRDLTATVRTCDDSIRKALGSYQTRKESERRERERVARAEMERRAESERAERERLAAAVGVSPDLMPDPMAGVVAVAPDVPRTFGAGAGAGVQMREHIAVEVVDANLVPRAFCVPDEPRIREYVKGCIAAAASFEDAVGVLADRLPGVRIEKEFRAAVR